LSSVFRFGGMMMFRFVVVALGLCGTCSTRTEDKRGNSTIQFADSTRGFSTSEFVDCGVIDSDLKAAKEDVTDKKAKVKVVEDAIKAAAKEAKDAAEKMTSAFDAATKEAKDAADKVASLEADLKAAREVATDKKTVVTRAEGALEVLKKEAKDVADKATSALEAATKEAKDAADKVTSLEAEVPECAACKKKSGPGWVYVGGVCKLDCDQSGIICKGSTLKKDGRWTSPKGNVYVKMQQDGNAVIYGKKVGGTKEKPLWYTNSHGDFQDGYLKFESDCTLKLHSADGKPSKTVAYVKWGKKRKECDDTTYMAMQDDCNLVMYNSDNVMWARAGQDDCLKTNNEGPAR